MSAYDDIKASLFKVIEDNASDLPEVAWPNKPYHPVSGTPWIKPTIMFAEPRQAELGEDGMNYLSGILQVSIFIPLNVDGDGDAADIAAKLIGYFKRGTKLTSSATPVICERAWPSAVIEEDDWYHVPVSVAWYSYAAN